MRISPIIAAIMVVVSFNGVSRAQERDRFHHTKSAPKVNYDSLFAAAVPLGKSEAGRDLVEKCLNRYGGVDKLAQLQDFRLTYEVSSRMDTKPWQLTRTFQRGGRYRTDNPTEHRILNGKECWFVSSDTLVALDQGRYRAELYSYLVLSMPLGIRTERFDSIRYGERSNDPLGYVYLEKKDSLLVVLGIDPEDHLIHSTEGIIRQGDKDFVFIGRFADYQSHNGYVFAGEVTMVSMGLEVGRARLTSVDVNPGLGASVFRP